jgi:hypothetical protein
MSDERKERCGTCRFWTGNWNGKFAEENEPGDCKRNPPSVPMLQVQVHRLREARGAIAGEFTGVWPETNAKDWCGEWQSRYHPTEPLADPKQTTEPRAIAYPS